MKDTFDLFRQRETERGPRIFRDLVPEDDPISREREESDDLKNLIALCGKRGKGA